MENMEIEIWADIEPKGHYQVSNFGRVKSLDRYVPCSNGTMEKRKSFEMKLYKDDRKGAGYIYVSLKSLKKRVSVHRLVAEAFLSNPENLPVVNHIDGNKENNHVKNLEWCSTSDNVTHAHNLGLINVAKGKNVYNATKIDQFDKQNNFIRTWNTISEASKSLKICSKNISACARGRAKSAGGFIWKYHDKKSIKLIENLTDEIWKDVVGYEGSYQVSNFGRFKSLDRITFKIDGTTQKSKGQILKIRKDGEYMVINFGKYKKMVHRCIAEAFLSNPNNLPMVNHKDGNKSNNHVDNLEWSSFSNNSKHAYDLGLVKICQGKDSVCAISVRQFDFSDNFIKSWDCIADAHRFFTGNKKGNIYKVLRGEMNSAYGFKWKI